MAVNPHHTPLKNPYVPAFNFELNQGPVDFFFFFFVKGQMALESRQSQLCC